MSLLLDTHAILWALEDDPLLGAEARRLIEQAPRDHLAIADISLLEIAMLVTKGRITVSGSLVAYLGEVAARFVVLPIDSQIASEAVTLSLPHGDPFDRLIVATARRHGHALLTRDKAIQDSGLVPTVWGSG